MELVGQSSEESEVPFAHHGPIIEADSGQISIQRDFWGFCAIGFILDYRNSQSVTFNISSMLH